MAGCAAPKRLLYSGGNRKVLEKTHITGCASNVQASGWLPNLLTWRLLTLLWQAVRASSVLNAIGRALWRHKVVPLDDRLNAELVLDISLLAQSTAVLLYGLRDSSLGGTDSQQVANTCAML